MCEMTNYNFSMQQLTMLTRKGGTKPFESAWIILVHRAALGLPVFEMFSYQTAFRA